MIKIQRLALYAIKVSLIRAAKSAPKVQLIKMERFSILKVKLNNVKSDLPSIRLQIHAKKLMKN